MGQEVMIYQAEEVADQVSGAANDREIREDTVQNPVATEKKKPIRIMFYGQHSDERVLYVVREHPLVVMLRFIRSILAGVLILIGFNLVANTVDSYSQGIMTIGVILALLVGGGGAITVLLGERKNIGYITDRRVIRFSAVTPWAVNSRSLTWDQAVKVKTFPRNFLYRMMNIGSVVVHAKSTVISSDEPKGRAYVSDDDVELKDVHFYQDLGNYIDKILYLYERRPEELETMKGFVAKPRGLRGN